MPQKFEGELWQIHGCDRAQVIPGHLGLHGRIQKDALQAAQVRSFSRCNMAGIISLNYEEMIGRRFSKEFGGTVCLSGCLRRANKRSFPDKRTDLPFLLHTGWRSLVPSQSTNMMPDFVVACLSSYLTYLHPPRPLSLYLPPPSSTLHLSYFSHTYSLLRFYLTPSILPTPYSMQHGKQLEYLGAHLQPHRFPTKTSWDARSPDRTC